MQDFSTNQHFKFFVGFQVWVCSNLCNCSDWVVLDFKASSLGMIDQQIKMMVELYRPDQHLKWVESLGNYHLTEPQFAHFVGKGRMYQHLLEKESIPEVLITDS